MNAAAMVMDASRATMFAPPPPAPPPMTTPTVTLLKPKPFKGKTDIQKLYELMEPVIAELNMRREYEALGVIIGDNPSEHGWVACSPVLCADRPSGAEITAQVNLRSGIYAERSDNPTSGSPQTLTLFDVSSYSRHVPLEEVVAEYQQRHEQVQQAKQDAARRKAEEEAAAKAVLAQTPPAAEQGAVATEMPPAGHEFLTSAPVATPIEPAAANDDDPPFVLSSGPAAVPSSTDTTPSPGFGHTGRAVDIVTAAEPLIERVRATRQAAEWIQRDLGDVEEKIRRLQEQRVKLHHDYNLAALEAGNAAAALLEHFCGGPPASPRPVPDPPILGDVSSASSCSPATSSCSPADGSDLSTEIPIGSFVALPESLRERLSKNGIPTVTVLLDRYREGSLRGIPRIGDSAFAKIEAALGPFLSA